MSKFSGFYILAILFKEWPFKIKKPSRVLFKKAKSTGKINFGPASSALGINIKL